MNEDWRSLRACKGMSVTLFFPKNRSEFVTARNICRSCPVSAECLNYAVSKQIAYGVWGGTGERERAKLIREYQNVHGITQTEDIVY